MRRRPLVKLTREAVAAVRKRALQGEKYRVIAEDFGISSQTVRNIRYNSLYGSGGEPVESIPEKAMPPVQKTIKLLPERATSRVEKLIRHAYDVWHFDLAIIPEIAPDYREFPEAYGRQMQNIWNRGWSQLYGSPEQKRLHLLRLEQEGIVAAMERIRQVEEQARNARLGRVVLT